MQLMSRPGIAAADLELRVGAAWRELRRLSSSQALRERIRGDGPELDLGQADALAALVQLGPTRMGDLAEALRVDASTATRAVDKLVEAGLARRDRHTDDRRVVVIEPTQAGVALHERWKVRAREVMGGILAGLPARDRERLAELMEQLVTAADRYLSGA